MPAARAVIALPTAAVGHPALPEAPAGPPPAAAASARLELARAELSAARSATLGTPTAAELILLVEQLRGALSDALRLRRSPVHQWAELQAAEEVNLAVLSAGELRDLVTQLCESLAASTA